ncbi:DUF5680 domain-containing protein [Fodinisporobacter ferrooxydans]|uniref:DUF5680 domain-containing protein n=1 Tax=Fodinisporobacter ferrooxydans TaxID=2901836 RepID=A0ABY4CSH1_9BACL|nr:DUF5680 domain-containing protein [Alicyclobacillaceae bacterium MYW30-H2]
MNLSRLQESIQLAIPYVFGDAWLHHANTTITKYEKSYSIHPYTFQLTAYGYQQYTGWLMVFEQDQPIWNLMFNGNVLDRPEVNIQHTLRFLLSSIQFASSDHSSFRGPSEHSDGNFRYRSTQIGTIDDFEGREWIEIDKQVIYRGAYNGGLIR